MKGKAFAIWKSVLWGLVVLLFPIASGALSVILSLNPVETLFLQGCFMLASLLPPIALVMRGQWLWSGIGFSRMNSNGCKRALYFIPLLAIFIPAALKGFVIQSAGHLLGSLFLYLFVGISEETYFRGIIPAYLKPAFSTRGVVLLSSLIFALGHMASALSGNSMPEVILSVLNAFIFGWMAMEMTLLSESIIPAASVHFLFDFETKITVMGGSDLLIAEGVRGTLMFAAAVWLAVLISRDDTCLEGRHSTI